MKSKLDEKECSIKILPLPSNDDPETLLYWLLYSLSLVSERDKDSSKIKIFLQIQKSNGLSSEDLSKMCNLSRATVIFHARKMIKKGLIKYENRVYFPVAKSYEEVVSMIEKTFSEKIRNIKAIAKLLDNKNE